MPIYINPPGPPTDPDELAQGTFDVIRESFPRYSPRESQLATIVITALTLRASQINDLAQMIPRSIFRYFGANVLNLPPDAGAPAEAVVVVFTRDTAGYTIEAEREFDFNDPATGQHHTFALLQDLVIPSGQSSGSGVVLARDDGTQANNIFNATVSPIDADDSILRVDQQGASAGGVDEEDDDDYLDRLTTRASLPVRPVWASDFAALVRVQFPQIFRTLFIDNFIPPDIYNAERAVAGLILDADGNDLEPTLGEDVEAYLKTQREWGFIANILSATYTLVDATYGFTINSGYDAQDVKTRSQDALAAYLSPARWGSSEGDGRDFTLKTTVYFWEIVTVLNNVIGLDRLTNLTIGVNGGAQVGTDVQLAGAIPLPRAGTISGTPDPTANLG